MWCFRTYPSGRCSLSMTTCQIPRTTLSVHSYQTYSSLSEAMITLLTPFYCPGATRALQDSTNHVPHVLHMSPLRELGTPSCVVENVQLSEVSALTSSQSGADVPGPWVRMFRLTMEGPSQVHLGNFSKETGKPKNQTMVCLVPLNYEGQGKEWSAEPFVNC